MKHLNTLPDLVLRLIFSKLSLVDLLTAARVCRMWKSYQMEISAKVDSLTVLIGPTDPESLIVNSCFTHKYRHLLLNDDGTRMYLPQHLHSHFHLKYKSFSYDAAAELIRIFPHVTTLEFAIKVYHPRESALSRIVALLRDWSPVVKSLKIYLHHEEYVDRNEDKIDNSEFVNLLAMLNSLPQLEHLTMDIDPRIHLIINSIRFMVTLSNKLY